MRRKAPVAHDGWGKAAKRLLRWALVPLSLLLLCVGASLANMHWLWDPYDKTDQARLDITNLHDALAAYERRQGSLPPEQEWMTALVNAQILEREVLDPWQHPYRYQLVSFDAGGRQPMLTSDGRDGEAGTDDDIPRPGEVLKRRGR